MDLFEQPPKHWAMNWGQWAVGLLEAVKRQC